MNPIAVSWALAQTVDGALKIGREAAIAASDDNVQLIALEACQRFGATIAVSSLTRTKIEALIRQQASSPVHKFLLAKIGYARGGAIDALSKSTEGIRFLSLAAALTSTNTNFDAAIALQRMVEDTAEDKNLVPTTYQLKDLLDVLEPRLNKSRFLDEVVGYQTLFLKVTNMAVSANIAVPSSEAICELVKSFRELSRLGNADMQSLKITVGPFAAWVSAFARWSVEVPPQIQYQSEEEIIIDQQNSKVVICISNDNKYEKQIEIETRYTYRSASRFVSAIIAKDGKPVAATGMVSLENLGVLTLRAFDFHDDLGLRACKEAVPFALHRIWSNFARTNESTQFDFQNHHGSDTVLHLLNPFPDEDIVATVMQKYLGFGENKPLTPLQGHRFGDLPLVRLWIQENKTFLELKPELEFLRRLSHVVADILALSLIVGEEPILQESNILLLYTPNRTLSPLFSSGTRWQEYIENILQNIERPEGDSNPPPDQEIKIEAVIIWALKLVGHDVGNDVERCDWVASAFRGQVLLPRVLLANEIPSSGFACLSHFTGGLMLETQKDRKFSRILSKGPSFVATSIRDPSEISANLNTFPGAAIRWELSSKAEHLEVSMGWTLNRNSQRPLNVVTALMGTVMMSSCSHSIDMQLSVREQPVLLPPGRNRLYAGNSVDESQIVVYPIYGSEDLKLLALASIGMMPSTALRKPIAVVNRGACLDCVLGKCRFIECGYVVL